MKNNKKETKLSNWNGVGIWGNLK